MVLFLIVSNGERPLLTAHNSKIMTCHLHCSLVLDFIVFDGYVAVAAAAAAPNQAQSAACCLLSAVLLDSAASPVEPARQTCLSIQTKNNEKLFNKNYFAWTTRQKILSSAACSCVQSGQYTTTASTDRAAIGQPWAMPATRYQLPLAVAGNLNAPN